MKLYSIFGNPIGHSKSPQMYNNGFKVFGANAVYTRYLLQNQHDFKSKIIDLKLLGGNVTIPHKEVAYTSCDRLDNWAKQIEAVNTFVVKDNKIYGYNTDGIGFLKSLENQKFHSALILGAGGTAKAIAIALKSSNIKVSITNRSDEKLKWFRAKGFQTFLHTELNEILNAQIIINTTSAGMNDNELPLEQEKLKSIIKSSELCYDVIYGKQTPFLTLAQEANIPTQDGLDMLLYQGFFAFKYFLDINTDQHDAKIISSLKEGLLV